MKGWETSGTSHNLGYLSVIVSICIHVIMIRLEERMTIKLRKNIMFRGLQRWEGCDRFT